MRETLIKLDDINKELQQKLHVKDGVASIDKKWLFVFDTILEDIIQSRVVVDFATKKGDGIDWEFVQNSMKKTKRH